MTTELPSLVGGLCHLEALTPAHESLLFPMAYKGEIPWQWGGLAPSVESFHHSLWDRALLNFSVLTKATDEFVGFVGAYGANFHHGTAFIQVSVHPLARGLAVGLEAVQIFLDHLFGRFNIRKIYAEVTDSSLTQFSSLIVSSPFVQEARLKEYIFAHGKFQDVLMLGCTKDEWQTYRTDVDNRRSQFRTNLQLASINRSPT